MAFGDKDTKATHLDLGSVLKEVFPRWLSSRPIDREHYKGNEGKILTGCRSGAIARSSVRHAGTLLQSFQMPQIHKIGVKTTTIRVSLVSLVSLLPTNPTVHADCQCDVNTSNVRSASNWARLQPDSPRRTRLTGAPPLWLSPPRLPGVQPMTVTRGRHPNRVSLFPLLSDLLTQRLIHRKTAATGGASA